MPVAVVRGPGRALADLVRRQVRLPVGASEQEVIGAMGEPQSRRTLTAGGEAWNDMRHIGGDTRSESEAAGATLWFNVHRLVDAKEYIYIVK